MPKSKHYTNKQVAGILQEIAELSKLNKEDKFHILAYEKAARSVLLMGDSVQKIYQEKGEKGLIELEAIGPGIAKKLGQFFTKGKMTYYESLRRKTPLVELEMMDIPGVGAKTSIKLYKKLKPKNLTDLRKKLKSDRAKKYFGVKTLKNIEDGIKVTRQLSERILLLDALPIAEEVLEFLRARPEVAKADVVGSVRRMREDVGDIDLVASTKDVDATMNAFASAPFSKKILRQGDLLTSIVHIDGPGIDLEVIPSDKYGNLLQHFSGSKDHAVELRTWAQQNGMSVSQEGIKKGRRLIKCKDEECVYKTLGMQYIPPEIRENKGEIELALEHKIPKLVELKDVQGNVHIHTNESDGKFSLDEIVESAYKYGYKYIAITDHSKGLGFIGGLDEKRLKKHAKKIRAIDKKYSSKGMRVFTGVELNILSNGDVDIESSVLRDLDFVTASIHFSFRQSSEVVTARLIKAIENPNIDCIGHPTGRKLLRREGVKADWKKVFKVAAKHKTLLEINATPDRLDLNGDRIKLAKDLGCKFVITTDAHRPDHFDYMRFGIGQARRGWAEKKDIINTKTATGFIKWIKSR